MRLKLPDRSRSRPGRRVLARSRDAEATREALLRAATELFAERGFEGVRVELIARKAGVTKALVNYHFGGKRRLYLAIFRSTFAEIVARVGALRASARPAPELLQEFVAMFAEMATERRPNFPALLLREVLDGARGLDREIFPPVLAILGAVREIVARGVREGSFRPVDPVLTHLSLVGSLVFFFATAPFRERAAAEGRLPIPMPTAAAYVRHVQELMTRGLATGPPAATAARGPA
jgi:TetR/AcrR family transcriptional regulator